MDLKLEGQTAVVTGSTGGIGLEIARRLAQEGADVVVSGRGQSKVDAAVADIKASGGSRVRGIAADVTTAGGAAELIAAAGEVHVLVNNLGIYESKDFVEISDEDWMRYFEINVLSGARLARMVFPDMLKRNQGRIIFIASEAALAVPKDMIHYAVSKTAQLTISRGLAELTKGTRVTVNAVMPGPTYSQGVVDFLDSVASDPGMSLEEKEAEFFATARQPSLLQRLIRPEEIANMVAFLASPLSSPTNGAAIRVEGGLLTTIA
jgi:NAD(P)-dependent dehydrogenase (short-subunit alcohol dehydrogenase family)